MTGEQFVKLCYDEKEAILSEYFRDGSQTMVAEKLRSLFEKGSCGGTEEGANGQAI